MKALKTIAKILVALAAVAGVVYVVATYGEKIVAWAKSLWARITEYCGCNCCCCCGEEDCCNEEDCCCNEEECQCATAEEVVANEVAPSADEADFAQ